MRYTSFLWCLVATLLWVSACGEPADTPAEETDCDDGEDEDGDGLTDCDDPDCVDATGCVMAEVCDNGTDDDGDGEIDCDDSDCEGDPACAVDEVCDDGLDNDGDGEIDCDDDDCEGDPACVDDEVCDDGLDNDGDGEIDCDDDDCEGDPACAVADEICDDGLDNDGDELIDCDDDDCDGDAACFGSDEVCDDGTDDDGDGLIDCADPDCDLDDACPELCNGEDDDGDGRIDELPSDPEIGEACYDGPAEVRGVGMCEEGTIECFGGELLCIGWVAPSPVELCDGLDSDCDGEIPPDEVEAGCGTVVVVGRLARVEFRTEVRDVDVHINLDTTGSMGGELDTLRDTLSTTIVPAIREALPTSQFGVSTFDDFPVGGFGSGSDLPFFLHQRVTSNVPMVQSALDGIPLHSGNDGPESGIESLYQIATGDGVSWPGEGGWTAEICDNELDDDGDGDADCTDPDCAFDDGCSGWPEEVCDSDADEDGDGYIDCDDPDCAEAAICTISGERCPEPPTVGYRAVTTQIVDPGRGIDAYSVSVGAGDEVTVQMFARNAGSPLDPYLSIYSQADGSRMAGGDDFCGLDSFIEWTAPEDLDIVIYGHGYSSSTGWYAMQIFINGVQYVADAATCSELEVGDEPFTDGVFDPDAAVPLVPAADHYPIADIDGCIADCEVVMDDPGDADDWAARFCEGPPAEGECGDGTRGFDEECDDGNTTGGDGCAADCTIEAGCGNGLLEPDEVCDDGNTTGGDGCSSDCELEDVECGDGVVGPGEECDDGGTVDGDGCDSECMLEPECGNGHVDDDEECDDGNVRDDDGCSSACLFEGPSVAPFFWEDGYDPGLGHGSVGGVGFRETALPVVVHITDAVSHPCTDYTGAGIAAHCAGETFDALNDIGARVVAVRSGAASDDPTDLRYPLGMVMATDSVVPPCAFDGSEARTSGVCGAGQCCTGIDGAGEPPTDDGECPLVFQITGAGAGLDTSIVGALDALTQFVTYDLTVSPRDDETDDVNALCFVETLSIVDFEGPEGTCAIEPEPVDTDGDGLDDTLTNATPRTRVTFEVGPVNQDVNDIDGDGDIVEECAASGRYGLYLDVVAGGSTVVGTRRVVIEVP